MSSDFAKQWLMILQKLSWFKNVSLPNSWETAALPELIRKDCYYGFFLYVLEYFVTMERADFPS